MNSKRIRWGGVALIVALLSLTPLTFSPADGVAENQVCGTKTGGGTCIRETASVCAGKGLEMWDYYYEP
ncbi:MAG: hypothetical protein ACE5JR_11230 [Gemmatimonadota bacterium]